MLETVLPQHDAPVDLSARRASGPPFGRRLILPFATAWRFRELISAVLRRELAVRFRGSVFGWAWAVAAPLLMLGLYTLAFSGLLRLPTAAARGGTASYALVLFVGLIFFNLFAELCYRAPLLLHEHARVIKTSIFPSETLAWIALLRAHVYAGISLAVFLVFQLALSGGPPWTVVLMPLVVVPFALFLLGLVWFFAALGAFTRDIAHLMVSVVPVLMFVTPVFYSPLDLPQGVQIALYANPLADAIQMARALLLTGTLPPLWPSLALAVISVVVFFGGHAFFVRYRAILVDVL